MKLAKQKQLNTEAHLQTVAAKRVRIKNDKTPPSDYKTLARKRGRQVSRYKQQNKVLRQKVCDMFMFVYFMTNFIVFDAGEESECTEEGERRVEARG